MNIFRFSLIFLLLCQIITSFGGFRPRSRYKSIFPKFSKFSLNFRENFDNFSNTRKISLEFIKNYNFTHFFLTFFENFSLKKREIFDFSNKTKYSYLSRALPFRNILYKLQGERILLKNTLQLTLDE